MPIIIHIITNNEKRTLRLIINLGPSSCDCHMHNYDQFFFQIVNTMEGLTDQVNILKVLTDAASVCVIQQVL